MANQRQKEDIAHFNHWSGSYEQHISQFFLFDPVHRGILDCIGRVRGEKGPETLLDVGCGTGRLLRKAHLRWPKTRLTGVDLAEGMIGMARRLTPGAEFIVDSAETLALPDASIDVAMSTISFHHWNDQAAAVRNIARLLSPGGIFVLADIVLPAVVTGIYGAVAPKRLERFYKHYQKNTPDTIKELFIQAGLAVQEQKRLRAAFVLLVVGAKG